MGLPKPTIAPRACSATRVLLRRSRSFGGTRRQVEALAAQEENQRFQLEAAQLTLTANLVAAVVTEASLRGQIAAIGEIIAIQRQALGVFRRQLELGQVAGAEVAAQEAALAQAEAQLPPLKKQLAQQRHLLAVLVGRFPSDQPNSASTSARCTSRKTSR